MILIEVSESKYINAAQVCSVQVFTHSKTVREDRGYGIKSKPLKVGESFTITIVTADGAEHRLSEEHSAEAYPLLFPEIQALP